MAFLQDHIVPLECNRKFYDDAQVLWKEIAGNTPEAKQFHSEQRKKIASVRDNEAKYLEESKYYAGQIINTDIDLMMFAGTYLTGMFEIIPVTGTNLPSYTLRKTPSVNVQQISAHGQAPTSVKYMSGATYFPSFYKLSTDIIRQPPPSILTGETGPDDKIVSMMTYEMMQTIEDDMWTLLYSAAGAFTVADTWVYDTRIQGLPTTNVYDFSSEGGLTVGLFRKIMAAVDLIPSGRRDGSMATIRNMFIPHSKMQDIRTWVSVVSNIASAIAGSSNDNQTIVSAELARQIERSGPNIDSLWGENVGIKRVNRPMGTSVADFAKYLWVFLDGPVGRFYTNPDGDRTRSWIDEENLDTCNQIWRTIGMDIPDHYRPNFMLVKFAT